VYAQIVSLGDETINCVYTQWDKRKLVKKVIGRRICDALQIKMAKNCEYKKEDIANVVLFSIADNVSIEYGANRMRGKGMKAPSGDDIFYHLDRLKAEEVLSAFYRVNSEIIRKEKRRRAPCAIDIHKIPYYGKHRDKHVVGMERARGTNYGYAYASIDRVDDKTVTLAAIPLNQLTTKRKIITHLVKEARKYVSIARAFLDRGFFNIESIRTLLDLKVHFVIPAMKNKRVSRAVKEAHIKARRIPGRDSSVFITDYTMGKGENSVTIKLVVVLEFKGKECRDFTYVTDMDVDPDSALLLAESYRKRWRIETGYRVKEEVRGKTCSRNYAVRLLLQLLSIILYNLWQLCNSTLCIPKGEGEHVIMEEFKDLIVDRILMMREQNFKTVPAH
jgi:hypothetical protein